MYLVLNKEYLADYHVRECESFDSFFSDLKEEKIGEFSQYPSTTRFPKAEAPLALVHPLLSNVYSIIPFYGTTIVYVTPNKKRVFQKQNGFSPDDIDKLVDFAKETGKIQFILSTHPLLYEGLDFLDPLFSELNVPESFLLPLNYFIDEEQIKQPKIEYETIAGLGFLQYIFNEYLKAGLPLLGVTKQYLMDAAEQYAFAKISGYNEIIELLQNKMHEREFKSVEGLIGIIAHFISYKRLPLNGIHNYSRECISIMRSGIKSERIDPKEYQPSSGIPFDIGRFLIKNKKLTNASGDFNVCKELCDNYRQSDLYKLLNNLQSGVDDKNIDQVGSTKEELDEVLETLWSDADYIRRKANIIKEGIPVSIGLIGELAGRAIDPNQGLGFLTYLGYKAVDKIVGPHTEEVSNRLAKFGQKDYLVGIYDFKEKKIPKSLK